MRGQTAEQLAHFGESGAQLNVADLDGQHRILQHAERAVRPAGRLYRAVDEAFGAARWSARRRR